MQLRDNLAYGEHATPPPRSSLGDDASATESESFIISRPWFMYWAESFEFMTRSHRIPWDRRGHHEPEQESRVERWWKERGEWKSDWEVPGWKWRHESPSPEPEDLSPLITDDMDFTPSEVDALEAVPPPSPPPPWYMRSILPEYAANDLSHQSFIFQNGDADRFPDHDIPNHDIAPLDAAADAAAEPEDQPIQDAEPQPPNPLPRRRGRPRKQNQPAQVAPAPLQAPRRSARIAAIAANLVPATPTVTTGRKASKRPSRAVPAAPPPRNTRSTADPPKKRGRPRKTQDAGIAKAAASQSKRARKPSGATGTAAKKTVAAIVDAREGRRRASGCEKGSGRPRKTQLAGY
ncbi:uncharacterized protein B0T15DRAFT_22 [Chaetomium strumarium]|uniref:Uncharacterized protein n=1 Tax=Chaetomium strumarium TaxID=1170767 RepID=A0AAJ0H016_9PEZI|nr:hypothetical protein B0T15DRAFT_22 [Chaetomium strumarium]